MSRHRCFDYRMFNEDGELVCDQCGKKIKWNPKKIKFDSLFRAISIGLTKAGGCNNKLKFTEKFCEKNEIDWEWLTQEYLHQGCDCEILMNFAQNPYSTVDRSEII